MSNSAVQVIPAGAPIQLEYDTINFDTQAVISLALNSLVILSSGVFEITTNIAVDNDAAPATYSGEIQVNNIRVALQEISASPNDVTAFNITTGPLNLILGDTITGHYFASAGPRSTQFGGDVNWVAIKELSSNVL